MHLLIIWRNLMKYLKIVIAVIFIILVVSPISYGSDTAQNDEITKLRQKIVELENRIKDMEATLAKYQDQGKVLDESSYGWQNRKNWRRLETGMSTEQVLSILGEPIKTIDGVKTLWYYPDTYRGYVSFDDNGRLTGWHEP
jgi:outer membrane protein assembly factor BamE (lipoprotein component of BamABCDE complex)